MISFLISLFSRPRFISGSVISILLLTLSCSKSTDPDTNKPPDTGPLGILLSGADSDSALSGTSNHGPFAVPASEWDGDFASTRLEAVINPNSSVGDVNTALNVVGAKISCMRAGQVFTELVIAEPLPSVDSAKAVCSTLIASGAFLSAYPCFDPTSVQNGSIQPGLPANLIIDHLAAAKFPAAWNVRDRVASLHSPVTVLVADHFWSLTPHAEIPAQTFPTQNGSPSLFIDSFGVAKGNHGFQVAGTIGAKFDAIGSTGAYADPGGLLSLPCISISGLGTMMAVLAEMSDRLPASGQFILNTSFAYGGNFSQFPKRQRIEHALFWRFLTATKQGQFLHLQAAGNEGLSSPSFPNADYASPFTLSARFDAPLEMLQGTAVSSKDTADLTTLYNLGVANNPLFGSRTHNLLVVGSSSLNGSPSGFSNSPSDVRMVGEWVTLPCIYDDSKCEPGAQVALQAIVSGTSFATPQVAGLAAWLWSLSPTLTVDETIATIKNCFNGNWVDAYKAVLSLDHSIANADTRLSLLDIVDANGQMGSDMKFDEKDLQMFLDSIMYYEADRALVSPPWEKDHSPFDLNGDGYTGDTMLTPSTAPFDLDVNTPPGYSSVDVIVCDQPSAGDTTLNELAVTDRAVLLYYAYSPLYQGNDTVRDELFNKGCSPFWVGHDSTWIALRSRIPILGIDGYDTTVGGALNIEIDESRDSLSPSCRDTLGTGYRFQLKAGGTVSASAGGNNSNISASLAATLIARTQATVSSTANACDHFVDGGIRARSSVDFALEAGQAPIPFMIVVNGTISPYNTLGCEVTLATVDTTSGSVESVITFDNMYHTLPFERSDWLTPLPEHQVYRLSIAVLMGSYSWTVSRPGPNESKVDVSVALFGGQ